MIKLTTTRRCVGNRLKVLVHAPAGTGKTYLCSTTPDPSRTVIISAEAGLLSLAHVDVPVIEINNLNDLKEAYVFLTSGDGAGMFDWLCVDSISEIGEKVLSEAKRESKDPRQAYGVLIDEMTDLIKGFRDLDVNVYMTCKQERVRDEETQCMLYGPMLPGSKLAQQIPYLFDEVFALRVHKVKDDDGNVISVQRALQTGSDPSYTAKDRSGVLELYEEPDLSVIAAKIEKHIQDMAADDTSAPDKEIKSPKDLADEAAAEAEAEAAEEANEDQTEAAVDEAQA